MILRSPEKKYKSRLVSDVNIEGDNISGRSDTNPFGTYNRYNCSRYSIGYSTGTTETSE